MPLEDYTTPLVPVSEWKFYLYKVDYFAKEGDEKPRVTRYLVSTDTHLGTEAQDHSPGEFWSCYMEHEICEVRRPRQVGTLYGMRIDESAREAGEREARNRGLMT